MLKPYRRLIWTMLKKNTVSHSKDLNFILETFRDRKKAMPKIVTSCVIVCFIVRHCLHNQTTFVIYYCNYSMWLWGESHQITFQLIDENIVLLPVHWLIRGENKASILSFYKLGRVQVVHSVIAVCEKTAHSAWFGIHQLDCYLLGGLSSIWINGYRAGSSIYGR